MSSEDDWIRKATEALHQPHQPSSKRAIQALIFWASDSNKRLDDLTQEHESMNRCLSDLVKNSAWTRGDMARLDGLSRRVNEEGT